MFLHRENAGFSPFVKVGAPSSDIDPMTALFLLAMNCGNGKVSFVVLVWRKRYND